MDYSNPILVRARAIGGALGVLRPAVRLFRRLRHASYEEAFEPAFIAAIRHGDTVWDVGANIGIYVPAILSAVGDGRVVAIEPSPRNYSALVAAWSDTPQVRLVNLALSNSSGRMPFYLGQDSVNDSLSGASAGGEVVEVEVTTADLLYETCPPDVVKIDVEGFELEVLLGAKVMLNSRAVRCFFVEVHFQALARRGLREAPKALANLLSNSGYSVRWLDPSHLRADRK